MHVYDENGSLAKCHICGKPATGLVNITVNCASSIPSIMKPVCEEHNPYTFRLNYVPTAEYVIDTQLRMR